MTAAAYLDQFTTSETVGLIVQIRISRFDVFRVGCMKSLWARVLGNEGIYSETVRTIGIRWRNERTEPGEPYH